MSTRGGIQGQERLSTHRRYQRLGPAGGLVGALGRVRLLLPQPRGTRPPREAAGAYPCRDSIEGVPPTLVNFS